MAQGAAPNRLIARNDAARWRAVLARDSAADGQFLYGVRSTSIYCRPSCASRRPNRAGVVYFDTAEQAERSGFRACKRCRPREERADLWTERIRHACRYLANADGHVSLLALAIRLGGSRYHFQRNFKRLVGVTPREYADACRVRRLKRALRAGERVTDAIMAAGYGSSSRFYERALPRLGMTPTAYQNGGAGMAIRYAIVDSPVGRVLAATTTRGVCAVCLGRSDPGLVRALELEYPAAVIVRDQRELAKTMTAILAHLKGRLPRVDLPIDLQATSFQRQVWAALTEIPYGETRSYGQVAAAIGRPHSARAVGRACAQNPVALVIPCHRVMPASGGFGGYRWGVSRKKALLAAEQSR